MARRARSGGPKRRARDRRGWRRFPPAAVALLLATAVNAAAQAAQPSFSSLAELTPQNVRGLAPLLSVASALRERSFDTATEPTAPIDQLDSSGAADPPVRRFVTERARQIRFTAPDRLRPGGADGGISYRVAAPAAGSLRPASQRRSGAQLTAWDPHGRRPLWIATEDVPIRSGALLTAGGLIFYCNAKGSFKALDARTGRVLWTHKLGNGKAGEPVSYRGPDGHQYVGVLSDVGAPSEALYAFALPH
jgi:hypothetical protein